MTNKKEKAFIGIGRRIGSLVAWSVLSACLLVTFFLTLFQFDRTINNQRTQLSGVATVFASAVARNVDNGNRSETQAVLTAVARIPGLISVIVVDAAGNQFAVLGNEAVLERKLASKDSGLISVLVKGTLATSSAIVHGGKNVGELILLSDVRNLRNDLLLTLLVALAAACLASAFGLFVSRPLQQRIVHPITSLTSTIRKVNENRDFRKQVELEADGETKQLVDSFNSLMGALRSRDMSLQKVAYYDALTGLPNRSSMQHTIDEATKSKYVAAAYLIDVDGFREINDALGHSIGDAVLMEVAARFHHEAKGAADIYRIGSDEFMIVAPHVDTVPAAQAFIARYVSLLYEPLKILGHEIHVTAAVGVSLMPKDGNSSSEIMRHCDLALQEAKKLGAGRVAFFNPQMDEKLQAINELVLGLRQGLQRDEFIVHYQPQVNLQSGKVVGFEALVRWHHPVRGNISPALFIPVAEKAGLVPELGLRVLRESCRQATTWFKEGNGPYQVSVNVSAAQLVQAEFLRDVQEALSDTRLPPPLLCLELTESVFLGRSIGTVRHMFNDLKAMGIELALDDFGTGYSSLSYLEALPFDKVKIDRAFVHGVHTSTKKMELLKGIIALSHSLNMKVVAEGAETKEDIDVLLELNADSVQGFVYARPGPADQALHVAEVIDATSVSRKAMGFHRQG